MHSYTVKAGPLKMRLPLSGYGLCVLGVVALGSGIRLALISLGWPHTNFDEGTMGEMAMNIAFHGEHPAFFYGQSYMGSLQAYLGAAFFHLFGVSLFSLRLGTVLLNTLFLVSMYLLARLLYPPKLALLSTLLLALAAVIVYYREIQAIGGYPETLLFGSLLFVLASWLALTARQELTPCNRRRGLLRLLAFAAWGMVVGLGLWSDLLILPFVLCSGLLLLVTCWRDILSLAPVCLLVGFLIGGLPLILYNFQPGSHANSLDIVLFLFRGGAGVASGALQRLLPHSIVSTFLVGIPTMTNYPRVCDVSSTPFLGGSEPTTLPCAVMQGAWSLLWIALWISAVLLAIKTLWKSRERSNRPGLFILPGTLGSPSLTLKDIDPWPPTAERTDAQALKQAEHRQEFALSCARLALLLAIALTVVIYAISPTAALSPYLNARYLLCVLIGIPALLYPLWKSASAGRASLKRRARIARVDAARAALVALTLIFALATILTFGDIPNTLAQNAQQEDLVQHLERIGAIHIYSDFMSCDRIIFQSAQRITCSDLTDNLQPVGDRYKPNGIIVRSDLMSSYVFPIGTPQIRLIAQKFKQSGRPYHHYTFDGYVVYQPISPY